MRSDSFVGNMSNIDLSLSVEMSPIIYATLLFVLLTSVDVTAITFYGINPWINPYVIVWWMRLNEKLFQGQAIDINQDLVYVVKSKS